MPCGGSSKPKNREQPRAQAVPSWARGMPKNQGAAVAAPGVQGPKPERPCAAFRQAAHVLLTISFFLWKPSKPISASAHSADDIPNAPHRNGRACGATPRLAAAGCTKACRPRRWRFVACTSRRTVHRHAARPCNGVSTPRLKHQAASYGRGAFTLSLGVVLARVRAQADEAVMRGAESAMFLSERVGPRRPVCL